MKAGRKGIKTSSSPCGNWMRADAISHNEEWIGEMENQFNVGHAQNERLV